MQAHFRVLGSGITLGGPDPGGDGDLSPTSSLIGIDVGSDAAERIERELDSIAGVEIVRRQKRHQLRSLTVRLRHDYLPAGDLSRVLNDEAIFLSQRLPASRPDFSSPPAVSPIKRREAALYLGREMLNRREGGRMLARFAGNVSVLFLEIASALRDAECWRLSVGIFRESVDLIEGLVSRKHPS